MIGRLRVLAIGLAVLAAFVIPVVARALFEARAELAAAEAADDEATRVLHLGRALRWRVPGSPHVARARAELVAIGEAAEQRGDEAAALVAYREVRSALVGTRMIAAPDGDVLADVDGRIARLMAADDARRGNARSGGEAHHLALLEAPRVGDDVATFVGAAAFVLWIATSVAFLARGVDGRGRLRMPAAVRWGATSIAAFVIAAVALGLAR